MINYFKKFLSIKKTASLSFYLSSWLFLILMFTNLEISQAADSPKEITYPVKLFEDGQAKFFQYKTANNLTIRYFLIKSTDGLMRAAFDACDVCWPEGKGYYQKGDFMVCRNCGRRFASILINEAQGGCNPAPLKREIKGGKVIIKIKDILAGAQYFNFREGKR